MKSEVGSRNSELGSRNSELGSRNSELGSWKLEFGTKKSEIRSPYPAFVGNKKSLSGFRMFIPGRHIMTIQMRGKL